MASFSIVLLIFSVIHLITNGLCGDIDIGHSPSNIRYGTAPALRLSEVAKVFAASLGYTTRDSPIWKGLTVTSPFDYPSAVIVFGIYSGGSPVLREGVHYVVKEDIPLNKVFNYLTSTISNQAQRPVHFENAHVSDLINEDARPISLSIEHLDKDIEPDATFLQQMGLLPTVADRVKEVSSSSHGGQDIIFISIDIYGGLVQLYGEDSPKVKEASDILRMALSQAQDHFRKMYDDKVIFASIMLDNPDDHIRQRRAVSDYDELQSKTTEEDVNIADEVDEDFPVIFNIVLFLSIILILALIAVSVAMATMDPGRDSIIYRMTNPRMKKD